jgi:ferredoxin
MIRITFLSNDGKSVTAPPNSNLLRVSLREKGGIPFKCGGGLCGTCKCKVEHGIEYTDTQTFINGDVSVSW